MPGIRMGYLFTALLGSALLTFTALLEYTFVRFPASVSSSGTGPKANVALWFGPKGAVFFYSAMALVYVTLYLWVSTKAEDSGPAWRPGVVGGIGLGGLWLATSLAAVSLPMLGILRPVSLLGGVGLVIMVGALGGRATGRPIDGVLAGFWCGLVAAVMVAVTTLALDNLLASTFVHTIWANDPTCPLPPGVALAGCEIGDDLGLIAIELTALPILLSMVAAPGGLIASRSQIPPTGDSAFGPARFAGAPVIFAGAMVALLIAELTLKLV